MNTGILERLRGLQVPPVMGLPDGQFVVARLQGLDFEGVLNSPDFGYARPFDAAFAKHMVHTASHLLGGDACGVYAFVEYNEFSVFLNGESARARWFDVSELLAYLVAMAASKMSLLVGAETVFSCKFYGFPTLDLVTAYFAWRQQEAGRDMIDAYCRHVLAGDRTRENVSKLLDGLGAEEKLEILAQNAVDHEELPAWQRLGAAVFLNGGSGSVRIDAALPEEQAYREYVRAHLVTHAGGLTRG